MNVILSKSILIGKWINERSRWKKQTRIEEEGKVYVSTSVRRKLAMMNLIYIKREHHRKDWERDI